MVFYSGAVIVTITSAIHYHPSDKMTFSRTLFNKSIVTVPNKWKGYCYWRNTVFNGKGRMSLKNYFSFYVYNAYYYLFIAKDWGWFRCFNEAFFRDLRNVQMKDLENICLKSIVKYCFFVIIYN